jgi:hypothetical protein
MRPDTFAQRRQQPVYGCQHRPLLKVGQIALVARLDRLETGADVADDACSRDLSGQAGAGDPKR